MVQYKSSPPSTSELVDVINRCKTKTLFFYPYILRKYIRAARMDPEILRALASVDAIKHSGASFGSLADQEWAWENGLNLVVSSRSSSRSTWLLI
jgi:hypothetical protein